MLRKKNNFYIGVYHCQYCNNYYVVKGNDKRIVEMKLNLEIVKDMTKDIDSLDRTFHLKLRGRNACRTK